MGDPPKPYIEQWPLPSRHKKPDWSILLRIITDDLGRLLEEAYTAIDNGLNVLAGIGLRAVFDCASQLLGVDPNEAFQNKLKLLLLQGKIGIDEERTLKVLTDAGNAAAHRGWRPNDWEIDALLSIIENFLHRNFVLAHATEQLRARVPLKSRPKKDNSS
jgi:hypothetical protein